MALSRRKKIIIIVSAVALLGLIVIISVFASRKDEPEVTTLKIEVRTRTSPDRHGFRRSASDPVRQYDL